MATPESMEIDDSLYSRQRYMLGDQAMKMMASSSVLLVGCDPLGLEIAKNLILTGVKMLQVADSAVVSGEDVALNFYVMASDVAGQKTRAEACIRQLSELNPYVSVLISDFDSKLQSACDSGDENYSTLATYVGAVDCVIATQCSLPCQNILDGVCRGLGIKFISCNVFGLFSSLFCDFGPEFSVTDAKGEDLKEMFIANITQENPGIVTCLENQMHGLEDGDRVFFQEVEGMAELNGQYRDIKVLSPYAFTIGDTTKMGSYITGGLAKQILVPRFMSHQSLEDQLSKPDILLADFGKMLNPSILHIGFLALHHYKEAEKCLPRPWDSSDSDKLWSLTLSMMEKCELDIPVNADSKQLISLLSYTCRGVLPPLAAVVGGIASQEVLKSITGKYLPLKQWMYLDASELVDEIPTYQDSQVSGLYACLHPEVITRLAKSKVFMVGCGAIGCEMLKNLALLGVSTDSEEGKFVMTDDDVIEKSNLNRQFLFRSYHIRQHKSTVAAVAIRDVNPAMNVIPLKYKVSPDTEQNVFHDSFFEEQDVIVNALDNVAARRYVDSRCVTNQRPLVESGTMGPKGHVQVVVPFVTESYSSQHDPIEVQVPYCTLKSFPSQIEHTIQWARDKFESIFNNKPTVFNKFWKQNLDELSGSHSRAMEQVADQLSSGKQLKDIALATKLLVDGPQTWHKCVVMARNKFEKYFNHKALHLLHAFPLDTKLQNGMPFWSSPKRPPHPVNFDVSNPTHVLFVKSSACLLAKIHLIQGPKKSEVDQSITDMLPSVEVPAFRPTRKEVITDENLAKPEEAESFNEGDMKRLAEKLQALLKDPAREHSLKMHVEDFEKDDDSNHHIDFIMSASNLRAAMYGIEQADRLKTKKIAGNIIPAISTTTAAVAGLATIQFLQIVKQTLKSDTNKSNAARFNSDQDVVRDLAKYRNCFLNLALPLVVFSEPAAAQRIPITDKVSFTLWDRWEVSGKKDFKLQDFNQHFKSKLNLDVAMVMQGVRMVYVPVIPGHSRRLNQTMTKLIKAGGQKYVDLTISFKSNSSSIEEEDDLSCPPVRYFFGE